MAGDIGFWRLNNDGEVYESLYDTSLVTGHEKLLQRFLLCLLQRTGDYRYKFGKPWLYGCEFVHALETGRLYSEADVFAQFMLAAHLIRNELKSEERHTDDPEERFKDARLLKIFVLPTCLKLLIELVSDGGSFEFTVSFQTSTTNERMA